ncbi:MAG: carboxypeptidase regulatory-like domain-containing protein [Myxococcales bacterium]|nr:carboxypeptidase regulatory-like domain-containing protein [Myxococcales bacterium]
MQARTLILIAGLVVAGALLYLAIPGRSADSGGRSSTVDSAVRRPPRQRWSQPRLGDFVPSHKQSAGKPVQVSGRVRDSVTGSGVSEATLRFSSDGGAGTARSGSGGAYRVALPPGRYSVSLVHEQYVAPAPQAEVLVHAGGAISGVDFELVERATVAGRVVDSRGKRVIGAEVRIAAARGRRRFDTSQIRASTDGRGLFTMSVPPVEAVLRARSGDGKVALSSPLYLRPGATVSGVEIVIGGGLSLAGRVIGPDRQRVKDARVYVRDERGTRVVACDSDGAFDVAGFGAGRKLMQASAPGYSPSRVVQVNLDDRATNKLELKLAKLKVVSGRVLDAAGKAAAGASVSARLGAPGQKLTQLLPPTTAVTNVSGVFELSGVPDLPLTVRARAARGNGFVVRAGVAPDTRDLLLRLRGAGSIAGRVTSAQGRPLGAFTIYLRGPAGRQRVRIAASGGDFTIEGLMVGRYAVTISAVRHAPVTKQDVSVIAGAAARVDVTLEAGGRVAGIVVDKRGTPIPGAAVKMETGWTDDEVLTNTAGAFVLEDVARGRRSITVSHPSYDTRILTGVNVFEGRTASARVELTPHGGKGPGLSLSGIGAVLKRVETSKTFAILKVIAGSPAEVAGIAAGDHITSIDGRDVSNMTFADGIEAIRGLVGTSVRLRIKRGEATFARDVVRAEVSVPQQNTKKKAP